ncbi:hypothetical protein PQX77_009989 [Marasmius sp. AFHP31]|nr:hypothetical protein PQX77_009989 [Marasmius sp. AFHP31]
MSGPSFDSTFGVLTLGHGRVDARDITFNYVGILGMALHDQVIRESPSNPQNTLVSIGMNTLRSSYRD